MRQTFSVDCRLASMRRKRVGFDCLSSLRLCHSSNSEQRSLNDRHTPQHRLNSTQSTHLIYNTPSSSLTVSVAKPLSESWTNSAKLLTSYQHFLTTLLKSKNCQHDACQSLSVSCVMSLFWPMLARSHISECYIHPF